MFKNDESFVLFIKQLLMRHCNPMKVRPTDDVGAPQEVDARNKVRA
jgi:hypothetical protein